MALIDASVPATTNLVEAVRLLCPDDDNVLLLLHVTEGDSPRYQCLLMSVYLCLSLHSLCNGPPAVSRRVVSAEGVLWPFYVVPFSGQDSSPLRELFERCSPRCARGAQFICVRESQRP